MFAAIETPNGVLLYVEHLFGEEDQCIAGLVLGGGHHVAVRRQVVQEAPDVLLVGAARMGGVVDPDEAGDPADVRLLGVVAVLAAPADPPHLVEELGGLVLGAGHGTKK